MQIKSPRRHPSIRSRALLGVAPFAWGLAISACALWVRAGGPQRALPWTTKWLAYEPFHVVAHCILYGVLALLVRRFISKRTPVVLCVVLALGLLQELAQVIGKRSFGTPELFDLMVDALAALAALTLAERVSRHRAS